LSGKSTSRSSRRRVRGSSAIPARTFILVLDELHLQRGSAGTEVAYLLRLLLTTLGLTQPAHRHKLRILSSSASLPLDGDSRNDSVSYLWDMFGSAGLRQEPKSRRLGGCGGGRRGAKREPATFKGDCDRLCEALGRIKGRLGAAAQSPLASASRDDWRVVGEELSVDVHGLGQEQLASNSIQRGGAAIGGGLFRGRVRTTRANSLGRIGERLFGSAIRREEAAAHLVWLRSCTDHWDSWFGKGFDASLPIARFRATRIPARYRRPLRCSTAGGTWTSTRAAGGIAVRRPRD